MNHVRDTTSYDTCSCSAASATPRSCYECLNTVLATGEKCAVAPNGDCVAAADALATRTTTFSSASNTSYCDTSDVACASCRDVWTQEVRAGATPTSTATSASSPRVCVSPRGCICLAVCEAFHSSTLSCSGVPTIAPMASTSSLPPTSSQSPLSQSVFGDYIWLVVFIVLFVFMSIWSYQQANADEHSAIQAAYERQFRGRKKRETPKGPLLSLAGWRAYRKQLIVDEQERVAASGSNAASLREPLTNDSDRPDVVVQLGAGVRPASPSRVGNSSNRIDSDHDSDQQQQL